MLPLAINFFPLPRPVENGRVFLKKNLPCTSNIRKRFVLGEKKKAKESSSPFLR